MAQLRPEVAARPHDPTPHYLLAIYHARVGENDRALAELQRTAELGDGFLPSPEADFPRLKESPEFRAVMQRFAAQEPRTPDAPLAFLVPDSHLVPEGIARDPVSGDFYLGSGPQRRIVRVKPTGELTRLSTPADQLAAVLGLALDGDTRRLYAVTSDAFGYGGEQHPTNRVVAYDLTRDVKIADWPIAGAQGLNDLAITPDGKLCLTDSDQGCIWQLDPHDGRVAQLVAPGTFYGINGIAAAPDGEHLYLAHALGVSRYSLRNGRAELLHLPPRQTVAAIDGLYWWRGHLLGVQNVTSPGRVILIRLATDGVTATAVETLQSSHHPLFDTPTTGAIGDDGFYVLARTQIARFDPAAGFPTPDPFLPPAVIRVRLPAN